MARFLLLALAFAPLAQAGGETVSGEARAALDDAKAVHNQRHYVGALARYNGLIKAHPDWVTPRYLRWLLLADMGAASLLQEELNINPALPFEKSVDAVLARQPENLRQQAAALRPLLRNVVARYDGVLPTWIDNRGDTQAALDMADTLLAHDLPKLLYLKLNQDRVVFLAQCHRAQETLEAVQDLETDFGPQSTALLAYQAEALNQLGRHGEAAKAYAAIRARMQNEGASFETCLPCFRGEYAALCNDGQLEAAAAMLKEARGHLPPTPPPKGAPPNTPAGAAPDPGSADTAWVELEEAWLLMRQNRLQEANTALAKLEGRAPGNAQVIALRAQWELLRGNFHNALAFYRRLESEQTAPDAATAAGIQAALRAPHPANPALPPVDESEAPWQEGEVLVLCYHDIPDRVEDGNPFSVDAETLVSHIELLKSEGFHFIRLADLMAAKAGKIRLPKKSVLLTFDDGYHTHVSRVLPVLELYGIPGVFAAVTWWIDGPQTTPVPGTANDPCATHATFMNPAEFHTLAKHPLAEVICHSHDSHRAIPINAFGNTAPAYVVHEWKKSAGNGNGGYETDAQYQARVMDDLRQNVARITDELGRKPLAMAWPYGAYNATTAALAHQAGIEALMDLGNGTYVPDDYPQVARYLVFHSVKLADLRRDIRAHAWTATPIRGYCQPLKGVITADPAKTAQNIDTMIAQLAAQRPSHVVLDVSSGKLGPFFPTGYPPQPGAKPVWDWLSRAVRAAEARDIHVILRLQARDAKHLDALLKMAVGENIFLDYPATREEVAKAQSMRTEGHVMVPAGGPSNADMFVFRAADTAQTKGIAPEKCLFWADNERDIQQAACQGAQQWVCPQANRFNSVKNFLHRPPASAHPLILPPPPATPKPGTRP